MPCGQMNYGKCYKRVGRLVYLNTAQKPNMTRDYGSSDARARAIRRRVTKFSVKKSNNNSYLGFGPLFGLRKNKMDSTCNISEGVLAYASNSGTGSDVVYWKRIKGGNGLILTGGQNCNLNYCSGGRLYR